MLRVLFLAACATWAAPLMPALSVDDLVGTWVIDPEATKAAAKPNEQPPPGAKPESLYGKVKLVVTKETLTYTDWAGKNHAIPASALRSTGDKDGVVVLAAAMQGAPPVGAMPPGNLNLSHSGEKLTVSDTTPGKPPFMNTVVLKKGG